MRAKERGGVDEERNLDSRPATPESPQRVPHVVGAELPRRLMLLRDISSVSDFAVLPGFRCVPIGGYRACAVRKSPHIR